MDSIADFEFNTALLSEGVLLVSQYIRQNFSTTDICRRLQQLVDEARAVIPEKLHQDQQLEVLIDLFYDQWQFGEAEEIDRLSDAIWLDKVLERREGTPLSLGIIFLHIAHQLDLPLMPVIFPTQLILRAYWLDEEMWLINPSNGETLSEPILEHWIKSDLGEEAELEDKDFDEAENTLVVRNMLNILKGALIKEEQMELALRASEAVLAFNQDDPYEIRDRGLIYAQLDCNHIALSDLSYFIEKCPEDPIAKMIKMQIYAIKRQCVVLH
ncbi:invasion regulator SirB1 [Candidatus Regiella insecticola]|uniref:Transglutaminase-like superfamily protein n=1 Tax=Candidatus Regiella insecticola TaxID=138073 RepID=A0A6L2ZQ31_9ENTR|nr:invasion regulator SirB1 [Candidatus Regiella insecticola]GFN46913.1 transglutaminase-like superfamily protein [Candidatus Regiella insecticola]